ncbi:hypothetical protein HY627_01345 [Candidatus Uhrbacteria bacterium]|nr:hypothetical protein [Candidatus Uhrbacteria bacterium]
MGELFADSGKLDFSKSAIELERAIRGLNPWPGTWMEWKGKRLKILEASVFTQHSPSPKASAQGELFADSEQLYVQCATGALQISKLQLEGKSPMTAQKFLNGYQKFL